MIIVGSKALKYRFPERKIEHKDVDVIAYYEDVSKLKDRLVPEKITSTKWAVTFFNIQNRDEIFDKPNVEILIADNSEALRKYIVYQKLKASDELFALPEVLYSLKKSHIHFPIKFDKHISDYIFLDRYFASSDILKDITKLKFIETEERLGKLKTPSLDKAVDKFFDQSKSYVKSYFIHDDMHKAVAHYEEPLYLRMQVDKTKAKCEKHLWETFTFEDKCKCVLEEAYVIALERKILPSIYGHAKNWTNSEDALNWALMRICTTLCSGWFRSFATSNLDKIKSIANSNYVEDFLEKVHNGELKKIEDD